MARVSGNTLGLGQLGYATGHNANVSTTTSLNQANGNAGTTVSMDDFGIDEVDGELGITVEDTTPDEGSTMAVTLNFTNKGSLFLSKIGNQTRNFAWGHQGASGNGTYASADYSAQWTAPSVGSNTTATLTCEFNDFFNDHATNYGVTMTKSVTIQETSGGYGGGGGGSGGCFAIGTEVMMADGTWKRIENIAINDAIKTVDVPTLPDGDSYPDYATWHGTQSNIESITLEDGTVVQNSIDYFYDHYKITDVDGNELFVTGEHPFLIKRDDGVIDVDGTDRGYYRFVKVHELEVTDKVVKSDGTLLTLHSKELIVSEDQFVNINVEENDCYMVRWGTTSIVVHNKGV